MITSQELRGCHVALITPMTRRGNLIVVDHKHLFALIDACIEARVAGILFAGTTGQSATLHHDEQVDLVARATHYARGAAAEAGHSLRIIASAGSNATHEALSLTRRIVGASRPDALLHVTGYYNNPPQEGLRAHFEAVADVAAEDDTGVILYNIPGRTGSRLEVETIVELARHPAIVGVKEATGDLASVERIIAETEDEEFAVLSGEDHLVYDIVRRGGLGVISASANRWPREFQALADLALAGRWDEARELQAALQPCVDATFCVKNPIPLAAMFETEVRLPLVGIGALDEPRRSQAREKIARALAIASFPHVDAAAVREEVHA